MSSLVTKPISKEYSETSAPTVGVTVRVRPEKVTKAGALVAVPATLTLPI